MSGRHPSSLRWDALALGAVDAAERAALEAHLAGCERCRDLQAQGVADRERFTRFVFPRTVDAVRTPAPMAWGRLIWLFAPAVVLLAVMVGLRSEQRAGSIVEPSIPSAGPVVREANVGLRVFALAASRQGETPNQVRELHDGDTVQAGQLLGIRVSTSTDSWAYPFMIEGGGLTTLIGERPAGPFHGELDLPNYLMEGREGWHPVRAHDRARIYVLFSAEGLPAEALRHALDRMQLDADALQRTPRLPLPATVDGIRLPPIVQRSFLVEVKP